MENLASWQDHPTCHCIGKKALVAELRKIAGDEYVIDDDFGLSVYETDAYAILKRKALAVVLPSDTEKIVAIMRFCYSNNVEVVARGAGTSLVGGTLPEENSIMICLSRMKEIKSVNLSDRVIHVEAGISNIAVSQAVEHLNMMYAPDPSSQMTCSIGGNISTNAGGAHCLKYGVTSHNLLGVKMVLVNGDLIEVGRGLLADGDELNITSLICGSEGQFGIIVEAWLRLVPRAENARPILIGYDRPEQAGNCVASIIKSGFLPVAIEYMDGRAVALCDNYAKAGYPTVNALLIVEVEGDEPEIKFMLEKIRSIAEKYAPKEVIVSDGEKMTKAIWKGRKSAFGAMGELGDYLIMDGTVPIDKLSKTLTAIQNLAQTNNMEIANIFHAGDGNMHPFVVYDAKSQQSLEKAEEICGEILKICLEFGGCLTGEHGVGMEKKKLIHLQLNEEELQQQRDIKSAFDDKWLLNKSKLFPAILKN